MTTQYQFGPLSDGKVIIIAEIEDTPYVLKAEKSKFSLYFGLNTGGNDYYPLLLSWSSGGYKLSNEDGLSLYVYNNGVYVSETTDLNSIEYRYNGTMDYQNTAMYSGCEMNLYDANGSMMIFPYKTPVQEDNDRSRQDDEDYLPNYQGKISRLYIIGVSSYYSTDCNIKADLTAYLAYAGEVQYQSNYATTQAVCKAGAYYPICQEAAPSCGSQCYGKCSDAGLVCSPISGLLQCGARNAAGSEDSINWIPIIVIVVLLIIGAVIIIITMVLIDKFKMKTDKKLNEANEMNKVSKVNEMNKVNPESSELS